MIETSLFLDDLAAVFLNPFFLLFISIPITILLGILVGTWLSQPRKARVLKISPESGRGEELEIESEDTINAYCDPVGNSPPQRFIKRHQALNVMRKGFLKLQTYALWFARQGTAYTLSFEDKDVKRENPIKVSLRDAVFNLFGKDLYEKIPNEPKTGYVKDRIENSEVSVFIEFPKAPLTPEGLPSISSDDVRRGAIDSFIGRLVNGVDRLGRGRTAGEWIKIIFILGTGIAIGIVLCLVFGWGGKTVIQETTKQAISAAGF
jgi:hypothetical protein